jgi:hypothetical protein
MLDFLKANIRRITILVIVSAFSLTFSGKINEVVNEKSTCVCSYDGYGYYMYLTQFFQYRNLNFKQNELQAVQDKYCEGTYAYQLKEMDNGNSLDIYHMGQAYLELPAYAVGHVFAKIGGYPKDGFSKPYHIAFLLNALLFILLGLYFLNKILGLFFSNQVSSVLLVIIYFGTNFWVTAVHGYQLQHIYLFTLVAVLFYALLRYKELKKRKHLLIAALALGLITSIRPTHVLLGILPLLMLRKVYASKWQYWKSILLFPLAGLLFNLPQIIYWKVMGGSWFILNMHVEEIIIIDPHVLDFLFSYKKGWLLYSPVFLLLVPGFILLYKQRKDLFWAVFGTTALLIWVFASWECWWYAASFGSRAMVDLYPLLVVPLGFALVYLGKSKVRFFAAAIVILFTTGLSVFQSTQFYIGYLHPDRMTKSHYWYIFGKLSMPDYQVNRLEIDRSNPTWPEKIQPEKLGFGKMEQLVFCEVNNRKALAGTSTLLVKEPYFPKLKTDETLFEADIIYQNQDSLLPGTIKFEAFSKYNTYDWKFYSLPTQKRVGQTDTLKVRFNLPRINHSKDKIQIYIENPGKKDIIVHQLKIKALSLIRN